MLSPYAHHSYGAGGGIWRYLRDVTVLYLLLFLGVLLWLNLSGCVCADVFGNTHLCSHVFSWHIWRLNVVWWHVRPIRTPPRTLSLHTLTNTHSSHTKYANLATLDTASVRVRVCVFFHVHVTLFSLRVMLCWYCNPMTLWFLVMLKPGRLCVCVCVCVWIESWQVTERQSVCTCLSNRATLKIPEWENTGNVFICWKY